MIAARREVISRDPGVEERGGPVGIGGDGLGELFGGGGSHGPGGLLKLFQRILSGIIVQIKRRLPAFAVHENSVIIILSCS